MSATNDTNKKMQANSAPPLVTIGLPTFNRPEGLKKCLQTLVAQTYSNLEIIVSDNCSPDPQVAETIRWFAENDSRIKAFRQSENIGLEENFNFVFDRASAELFMWASDDDYYDNNYVAECVCFLLRHKDHILCSGVARYYSEQNFLFDERMFKVDQPGPFRRVYRYFINAGKNGNFYGVFRNKGLAARPIGPHVGCDWAFMARLALLGKLSYVNSTTYHRSAHGNSGTRRKMVNKFGLNRLQTIFFETYSAGKISENIFSDPAVRVKFNRLQRIWIVCISFTLINYRLFMNFLKRKMGLTVN